MKQQLVAYFQRLTDESYQLLDVVKLPSDIIPLQENLFNYKTGFFQVQDRLSLNPIPLLKRKTSGAKRRWRAKRAS